MVTNSQLPRQVENEDSKSASGSTEPDYLQSNNDYLRGSADVCIVVQGSELLCHKQVLALHSKVFAGMLALVPTVGPGASCSESLQHKYNPAGSEVKNSSSEPDC